MLRLPLRLSADTFALTWRHAEVGDQPAPLYVPTAGADAYGAAHAEIAAFTELKQLAGRDLRGFTTDLEAMYGLLCRAPLEYYGWMLRADGTGRSALVACHPQQAVRAVLDGDVVELSAADPAHGACALVAALPPGEAARFRAASAHSADLFGTRMGEVSGDVATLREVFATRPVAKGQLYVAVRGRQTVTSPPVNYIDPPPGRVLFCTGTDDYITAQPGTPEAISEQLELAHQALTTRRDYPPRAHAAS